jgi:hypothetical protein
MRPGPAGTCCGAMLMGKHLKGSNCRSSTYRNGENSLPAYCRLCDAPVKGSCRGRELGYPSPPAQIPACGFPAPGSCRRSDAIEVRGLGGPYTSNPCASSFETRLIRLSVRGMRRCSPSLRPTDFPPPSPPPVRRSALFEASLVLFDRPTPHFFPGGFVSSTSRRGPGPPCGCGRNEVSQVPTRSFPA